MTVQQQGPRAMVIGTVHLFSGDQTGDCFVVFGALARILMALLLTACTSRHSYVSITCISSSSKLQRCFTQGLCDCQRVLV